MNISIKYTDTEIDKDLAEYLHIMETMNTNKLNPVKPVALKPGESFFYSAAKGYDEAR